LEVNSIPLNFKELVAVLPEQLGSVLRDEPSLALPCLGLALYQVFFIFLFFKNWFKFFFFLKEMYNEKIKNLNNLPPRILPRLYDFEPVTPLRQLKANLIGK
jgi:hypothetical protein